MLMNENTEEILGQFESNLGNSLRKIFASIAITEEEITKAQNRYPEDSETIDDVFPFCALTDILFDAPDKCIKIHVRHLIERIRNNEDMQPGTDGEILNLLRKASLKAPPQRIVTILYSRLMKKWFPEFNDTEIPKPDYEGQVEELENKLRRKLSTERNTRKE